MLLSMKDIKRIEQLGYTKDFFVEYQKGWLQLKNRDGRCVFHDGTKCVIYEHRPEGCKLYPIIFDYDTKQAIRDKDCPYNETFPMTKQIEKQVSNLVSRIMLERFMRLF